MRMSDNVILITGGGTGIGLAFACRFAALGNQVVICGRRLEPLQAAKDAFPALEYIQADVSTENGRIDLAAAVAERFPALNVLVNNAGVGGRHAPVPEPQDWSLHRHEIAVNLEAPMHLSFLLARRLAQSASGAIINVSSGLGFVPLAALATYCLTKAAVHSFSLSLRQQSKATSLDVIEVIPPAVASGAPGTERGVDLDLFADSVFARMVKGDVEIGYGSSEERRLASRTELDAYFDKLNAPRPA